LRFSGRTHGAMRSRSRCSNRDAAVRAAAYGTITSAPAPDTRAEPFAAAPFSSRISSNCSVATPPDGSVAETRCGEQTRSLQNAAIHPGVTPSATRSTVSPGSRARRGDSERRRHPPFASSLRSTARSPAARRDLEPRAARPRARRAPPNGRRSRAQFVAEAVHRERTAEGERRQHRDDPDRKSGREITLAGIAPAKRVDRIEDWIEQPRFRRSGGSIVADVKTPPTNVSA